MFDTEKYKNETLRTKVESYDGGLYQISDNNFINALWQFFLGVGRWYAWKYLFYYAFIPLILGGALFFGTGKKLDIERTSEEMSNHAASDGWFESLSIFTKNVVKKSEQMNEHPYYHTEKVRNQENAFYEKYGVSIKMKKIFKYYTFENEDYLIMRAAAFGADKEKLKYELSTVVSDDAEDYCENMFDGHIWDDELRSVFIKKIMVRRIKDELTQDNDSGSKYFRCVIMPDTIEDEIDD